MPVKYILQSRHLPSLKASLDLGDNPVHNIILIGGDLDHANELETFDFFGRDTKPRKLP